MHCFKRKYSNRQDTKSPDIDIPGRPLKKSQKNYNTAASIEMKQLII